MCPPQHPADDAYTSNPLIAAHFSLTPPLTKIPSDHIYGSQSTFICTKIRALYAKHNLRNNRHYGLYYAGSNVTHDRDGQHERVMLLVLELSSEDIKAGKWRGLSLEDECKSTLVQAQGGNPDVLRGVCLRFYCRRAEDDKDDPNLTLEVSSVYQLERTPRFNFRAMEREPVWLRSAREPVPRTDFDVGQVWDVGRESGMESEDEVRPVRDTRLSGSPNQTVPGRRVDLLDMLGPSLSVRDTVASFRSNVRARQAAGYAGIPILSTAEDLESAMSSTDPSRNTSPAPPEPMSLAIRANSRSFWGQNLSRRNSSAVRPPTPPAGAGLVDSIVFASLEEAPIDPILTDLLSTRQELPTFNGETYSLTSTSEPPATTRSGSVNWWDTVDMNEAYPRESFTERQDHQALSDIILGPGHTEAPAADSVSNASSASLSARVARHQSRGATIPDERGGRRHAVQRVRVSSWNLPSNEEIDAEREAYESRNQHAVLSNSDGVATAGSGRGELSGDDSESEAAKESVNGEVAQLSRPRVIIDPTRDPSTTTSVFAPENRPGAPPPVKQTR
ncbi:hypothetical protein LTR10_002470 [Elasticomyces elasticus]|nr:hypothetical protein LTR10_002470 [Elasticomyces elasticus]KAK4973466.1 hypothetical protein LTR42_005454 [Elasticomyces elasticus]